jgi:ribonuclease HI
MNKAQTFDHIIVFGDGACSGNPGKGGWGAIVVTPDGRVKELGDSAVETTNNRMELIATGSALEEIADDLRPVSIYTDSTYVIRGITEWIWGWRKRGWKTAEGNDVSNKDLWEWLSQLVAARKGPGKVTWHYVRGHTGVAGNERVDEIAVMFSQGKNPHLYDGSLLKYGIAVHDIPEDTSLPEMKERKEKVAAHSYLSLVDGIVRRHATWTECERLVKGRSGAKFKKALSAADEKTIVTSWGRDPKDIT